MTNKETNQGNEKKSLLAKLGLVGEMEELMDVDICPTNITRCIKPNGLYKNTFLRADPNIAIWFPVDYQYKSNTAVQLVELAKREGFWYKKTYVVGDTEGNYTRSVRREFKKHNLSENQYKSLGEKKDCV